MFSEGELGTFGGGFFPGGLHLLSSVSCIPVEVGDVESEWLMLKAFIAEAASKSCGFRVIGALWWTLMVREAVYLQKEVFWDMLSWGTPGAVPRYQRP